MTKRGICRLCGQQAERLTADHVQPQCAFNEAHRQHIRLQSILDEAIRPNQVVTGPTIRNIYREIQPDRPISGGIYRFRQCKDRNNRLGRLYDARFGHWCHDAVEQLKPGEAIVIQPEYSQRCRYPLSILKRVVAMFFSINGDKFAGCHPKLSAFVRDPSQSDLPDQYQFFAAYNVNDLVSHIPLQFRSDVVACREWFVSQIAHPPFVYVMTINSGCPDLRLTDITRFSGFGYDDEANIDVQLRVLPTNSCFAGDFRASGNLVHDNMIVGSTEIEPSFFHLVDAVV
jgi:hypothetical protein